MKSYISHLLTLMMLPAGAAPALLGLRAETTEQAVQQSFAGQIPPGTGLTVHQLTPGTPAAEQLQPGDVLLQADGAPLHSPEELAAIVQQKQAGDTLHLVLLRHGACLELTLQLAARPEQAVLSREQQLELNRLLLLLVPHGDAMVNTPAVRRQLLMLSSSGIARKDEYATCTLYLRHNRYLITITSTERSLSITSNHPEVPDAFLRADFYQRDTRRLPEKLEQLILNAEYYHP